LRIGAFQAAALHLVPPALTALRNRDDTADISVVDIQSDSGVAMVAAGELDLAVIAIWDDAPDVPESIRLTHLREDPMILAVPEDHPLTRAGRAITLADVADESWVVIRAGHQARRQFDRAAATAGFSPRVRFETESYDIAQALVGTGYGVALVSELAAIDLPGTAHLKLASEDLRRSIQAVHPADLGRADLSQTFLELLGDVATDQAS